jgi:hypothetical protein
MTAATSPTRKRKKEEEEDSEKTFGGLWMTVLANMRHSFLYDIYLSILI